jgi:hypothetical protein
MFISLGIFHNIYWSNCEVAHRAGHFTRSLKSHRRVASFTLDQYELRTGLQKLCLKTSDLAPQIQIFSALQLELLQSALPFVKDV